MKRPSLWDRVRYAFDGTMSKGTPALIGWLALATVVLLAVYVAILVLLGLAHEAVDPPSTGKLF